MQCIYCTKQFSLASRIFHDPDFCSPAHRSKFNQQLQAAVQDIKESFALRACGVAGFHAEKKPIEPTCRSAAAAERASTTAAFSAVRHLIRLTRGPEWQLTTDTPFDTLKREIAWHQVDRNARLRKVSTMIAQLREQVEKRRGASTAITRDRALAPVIELRPAI